MRRTLYLALCLCICCGLPSCKSAKEQQEDVSRQPRTGGSEMAFRIASTAFDDGEAIPAKYTCDCEDVSPDLTWENAPDGAKSFALICDDPDAPGTTWVHWVVWGVPATATGLAEGVPAEPVLADGTKQGVTDFRRIGYGGPCPPGGKPHRYYFKLYALDNTPQLPPDATKKHLLDAMEGHILGQAHVMGTYQR